MQAALAVSYSEDMTVIKARSLLRERRYEAAVQLLAEAMEAHGRTRKVVELYQEAQRELKVSKQKDYYQILGVERDVDDRILKRLYRKLALQCAPPLVIWLPCTSSSANTSCRDCRSVLFDVY
jgi:hypothetical protein